MMKLSLKAMEPIAREATRSALADARYMISEGDKPNLTLGSYANDTVGVFELYIACEKPGEAKIVSRTIVDRLSGSVEVEIEPSSDLPP